MPITPLERVLANDLNLATGKLSAEAIRAHDQIEAHDRRVEEMPWYQRAFSYRERREERAELVRHFDRAAIRAEVGHEIADVVQEAVKQHQRAVEREPQHEPERTKEREQGHHKQLDEGLNRLAHDVWGRDAKLEHGHYIDANNVREVLKGLGYSREWVERTSERERQQARSRADDLGREL
jgi:hypothetical protein